jgi:hypothetical protein
VRRAFRTFHDRSESSDTYTDDGEEHNKGDQQVPDDQLPLIQRLVDDAFRDPGTDSQIVALGGVRGTVTREYFRRADETIDETRTWNPDDVDEKNYQVVFEDGDYGVYTQQQLDAMKETPQVRAARILQEVVSDTRSYTNLEALAGRWGGNASELSTNLTTLLLTPPNELDRDQVDDLWNDELRNIETLSGTPSKNATKRERCKAIFSWLVKTAVDKDRLGLLQESHENAYLGLERRPQVQAASHSSNVE